MASLILSSKVRACPNDWTAILALGHIHLRSGNKRLALRCYREVHDNLGPEKMRAQAAYMVARVHAQLHHPHDAGRWLVVTLDLDRNLLPNARLDPDFRPVQRDPDFRRRIGPSFDYGLDVEAP